MDNPIDLPSKIIEEIEQKPSTFVKVLNRFSFISALLCYSILLYLLIFHWQLLKYFFTDPSQLTEFITDDLRVPIFLVLFFFNTILSLNPVAQVVPLTSVVAFFYGFWPGYFFGAISFFLSTVLTVYLARHMGHKAVKKIIGNKNWEKANILANEEGVVPFFIAYLFPILPNSIITWIAGTTRINNIKLALAAVVAQSPGIILSVLIGSGYITQNFWLTASMFTILVGTSLVLTKYRKNLISLIDRNKKAAK